MISQAKQLNIVINHKQQRMKTFRFSFLIVLIIIELTSFVPIVLYSIDYADTLSINALLCYNYINLFRYLYSSQFVLASIAVRSRFEAINERLGSSMKPERAKLLHAVGPLYHRLCDVIELINRTFTMHLVIVLTLVLVRKVAELFLN